MSGKALLIIDMQRGDFPPIKPRYNSVQVIKKIAGLGQKFREAGLPVIYIQHDGTAEGAFIPGTVDWQILPELSPQSDDLVVSKTANNAFYRSDLDQQLKQLEISELFITGSATDFCVEATIQAALCLDYHVTVASDAHTSTDRPNISAPDLIAHYNWVWENMTPTQGTIRLLKTADCLKALD